MAPARFTLSQSRSESEDHPTPYRCGLPCVRQSPSTLIPGAGRLLFVYSPPARMWTAPRPEEPSLNACAAPAAIGRTVPRRVSVSATVPRQLLFPTHDLNDHSDSLSLRYTLITSCVSLLLCLCFDHPLAEIPNRLPQQVRIRIHATVANVLNECHTRPGHCVAPFLADSVHQQIGEHDGFFKPLPLPPRFKTSSCLLQVRRHLKAKRGALAYRKAPLFATTRAWVQYTDINWKVGRMGFEPTPDHSERIKSYTDPARFLTVLNRTR